MLEEERVRVTGACVYLFVCEKMKKAEPAGIGCLFVAILNSDILRGLADTPWSVPSSE